MKQYFGFILSSLILSAYVSACHRDASGRRRADHVIVENDLNDNPVRCIELRDIAAATFPQDDGQMLCWYANHTSSHPSSCIYHFDHAIVINNDWNAAYQQLQITKSACDVLNQTRLHPLTIASSQ